jgi:hypothetical protein
MHLAVATTTDAKSNQSHTHKANGETNDHTCRWVRINWTWGSEPDDLTLPALTRGPAGQPCSFELFGQINSHSAVFFSHNKLINSTFDHNKSAKRPGYACHTIWLLLLLATTRTQEVHVHTPLLCCSWPNPTTPRSPPLVAACKSAMRCMRLHMYVLYCTSDILSVCVVTSDWLQSGYCVPASACTACMQHIQDGMTWHGAFAHLSDNQAAIQLLLLFLVVLLFLSESVQVRSGQVSSAQGRVPCNPWSSIASFRRNLG